MHAKLPLKLAGGTVVSLLLAVATWGYTFITDNNGYIVTWPSRPITLQLKLATSPVLSDGASLSDSVLAAVNAWNTQLGVVQFSAQQLGPGAYDLGNGVNEIVMDSTIDGEAFGANVLAVTYSFRQGNTRTESDLIFNSAYTWDSYRGNLQVPEDIRRVAIHELGHVLGLNHPDQATPPQSVTAIMNSTVSNIDTMQPDDVSGAQSLYGAPGFIPANDDFDHATVIDLGSGSTQVTGTNVAATVQVGEPALDEYDSIRKSVWWKWTAPANGSITLTTLGSNFDTMLGVYSGNAVGVLTQIAFNDDVQAGVIRTSTITCGVSSGTTYSISVFGWHGYFGVIKLNLNFTPELVEVAPSITSQPASLTVTAGPSVQFRVSAVGYPAPSYRWQRLPAGSDTWGNLSYDFIYNGVFSNVLTLAGTAIAMNGDKFRCVVTNSIGSATSDAATLTVNDSASTISSASGGFFHSMILKTDGHLLTVGDNNYGQLGEGSTTTRIVPVLIGSDVASVSAGAYHSLYVKTDGTLWSMGDDAKDQLGVTTVNGYSSTPLLVASGVASVSAGYSHSAFIKNNGSLWTAGDNDYGQLGDGTTMRRNTPVQVATGVTAVATGSGHTMFIKVDKTLWAMGANSSGQLGDGTTTNRSLPVQVAGDVVAVGTGAGHTHFVKSDGTLWAMGYNGSGQLGDGTTTDRALPVQVASGVIAVATGQSQYHTLFIKTDGALWGMGDNSYAQLGDGTTTNRALPVQVASEVMAVTAGEAHSLFIRRDGTLWAMGYNLRGQLANGTTSYLTRTPVQVMGPQPVAPEITLQPSSARVLVGGSRNFRVSASGTPTLNFQWEIQSAGSGIWGMMHNGSVFSGVTSSTLVVTGALRAMSGDRFRCVVTNAAGSVTSNAAALTVMPPPADFNGDDQSDLFFTNTTTGERSVRLMNGTTLGSELSLGSVGAEWSAVTGDFNADGKTDVLWQNTTNGDCYIWLMNGTSLNSSVFLGNIGVQWSVAGTGDFNADGMTDIIWFNTTTGDRYVWLMNGTALSSSVFLGNLSPRWLIAGTGDFNADGQTDLVWQNIITGERMIWLMNGTVRSSQVSLGLVSTALRIAMVGDYNGDGKPDLVWQNTSSGERLIWLMNGTDATSSVSLGLIDTQWIIGQRVLPAPSAPVPSDFNADGQSDLIWSNTTNGDRYVWLMNGTSVSSSVFLGNVLPAWTLVTGDFNADGKTDLLWSNSSNGDRYVWLMNGTSISSSVFLGTVPPEWSVTTGDFNNDGKADLLWSNMNNGDRYFWLMNGTSINASLFLSTVPPVWSVSSGDFNNDGKTDLLWSNTSNGDRYFWLMNGTSISESVFLGIVPPVWRVSTGDFNGDGKMDLLWSNTDNGDRYFWLMDGTSISESVFLGTVAPFWWVGN